MSSAERIGIADGGVRRPQRPAARVDRERARRTRPPVVESRPGARGSVDPDLWLLHVQFERLRNPELRAALVEEYTGYCYSLARRAFHHREPLEDLRQVAMVALIAALERFECERSIPFTGFASPTIIGALKRHHRDQGWAVRVPREAHTVAVGLSDAEARADARLGAGRATGADVAEELGIDVDALDRARAAIRGRATVSIDAPLSTDAASTIEIATTEDGYVTAEKRVDLLRALDGLSTRDRAVLAGYFLEGRTQRDIGGDLGVSQMQVSRVLAAALARLRAKMGDGAEAVGTATASGRRRRRPKPSVRRNGARSGRREGG